MSAVHMITLKKINKITKGHRFYVVMRGPYEIGFIEKLPSDACSITPWQAWLGIGLGTRNVGNFYEPAGKAKALHAVIKTS